MLGHGCVAVKILSATLTEQFDYPIEKMQSNIVAIKVGACVADNTGGRTSYVHSFDVSHF